LSALVVPSPTGTVSGDYVDRIPYDFGVGYINPATLPVADLAGIAGSVIRDLGDELARYPARRGWEPLRAAVGEIRSRRDEPRPDLDSIVLANGSLGAIALATDVLAARGDAVLVEEWTYNVAMTVFRHRGIEIVPVAIDEDGLIPEALADACERAQQGGRRALLYTIPTFHNPTGITMPLERRRAIVDLARERDIAIVEDDCYGDLRYEGDHVPSLWSLAPERTALVGSLSKVLAPALRLGYVIAPEDTVPEFLARKLDGGTDLLASAVAGAFFAREGHTHLSGLLDGLRDKRDVFVEALGEHCPGASVVHVPEGGFYLWLRFAPDVSSAELLERALGGGVTFFSAPMCRADMADGAFGRFSFAWASQSAVEEGLSRLGALLMATTIDGGG
jgi:2-aminoadipate transaminase